MFLGVSGSGKGTQAALLAQVLLHARVVSTGEAFRSIVKRKNFLGNYIRKIYDRGGLMPYWAAAHVWLNIFFQNLQQNESIIFEGAPRRIEEAPMLDHFMRDIGRSLPIAIYLKLSSREAERRLLSRGRYDDNNHAIRGRIKFFHEHVQPVIEYYRRHQRLITIEGERSVGEIQSDIRKALRLR